MRATGTLVLMVGGFGALAVTWCECVVYMIECI